MNHGLPRKGEALSWSSSGWAALYSNDLKIASGIGGGVGKCAPWGWKPFSLATYVNCMGVPSSAVNRKLPVASKISWAFGRPCSCAAIPFSAS